MPTRRVLAVLAAAAMLTAACSGSDDSGLEPLPSASTDADGFTAEEREVVEAVDAYQSALIEYQKGDRDIDLTAVATDEVADGIVDGAERVDQDEQLDLIGGSTIMTVESVSIDGDTATWQGCNDSTALFLVPEGEDAPGVGSQQLQARQSTYTVIRQDETWVVSDATAEDNAPC